MSTFPRLELYIRTLKISLMKKFHDHLKFHPARFVIATFKLKNTPKRVLKINCLPKDIN